MGSGLTTAWTTPSKTKANIVYINGDPNDNNAALFKSGYEEALKSKIDSGDYTLVGDQSGFWDAAKAGTAYEQLYTQNKGAIDGVVSANDTMAGGIIARMKDNGVDGQHPGHRPGRVDRGSAERARRLPVRHGLQEHRPRGSDGRGPRDRSDQR